MRELVFLWLAAALSYLPPASKHFTLEQLAPGVWVAIQNDNYGHAICNAGLIDLGDKTVVVDPFMTPEAAKDLKKVAEQLTGRKVSLVINSHYHNDHIRGNQVFVTQASIISSEWTRNAMMVSEKEEQEWEKKNVGKRVAAEREKLKASGVEKNETIMWIGYYEGIEQSLPELITTVPDITFSDSLWIHGSNRSIKLLECKKAHTASDIVVLLQEDHIAFMGDIFFVNRHPWLGDGDVVNLQKYLRQFREDTLLNKYIPGHGPPGGKGEMQSLQNYLEDVQSLVKSGIEHGLPDSLIIQQSVPPLYQDWWYSRFYKPNLQVLCEQLRNKEK